MWIFTKHGFYSVVSSTKQKEKIQIRARCKRHLTNLKERFGLLGPILETENSDYRFRMIVARIQWKMLIEQLAREVYDYCNFKDQLDGDPEYQDAAVGVWTRMHKLQED